jgi:hypothetical protein
MLDLYLNGSCPPYKFTPLDFARRRFGFLPFLCGTIVKPVSHRCLFSLRLC